MLWGLTGSHLWSVDDCSLCPRCAVVFPVAPHSAWHNWGTRLPWDVGAVTNLGETAGRSPWPLFFVEQTLIKKMGEGCSLSPPPPPPLPPSLLLFLCCEKHFSKKISLMIQSLPHLPILLFIQEKQRCPVIITCPKEGKQLESNPVFVLHSLFWFWHFHNPLPSAQVFYQHNVPVTCL